MARKKQVDISASSLSNLEGMLNANIENFGKAFNEKLESMQTDTKKVNQNITLTWSRAVDQTKSSMAGLLDTVSSGLQSSSDAGANMIGVLEGVNNAITLIGDVGGIAAAFASGDVISGVASSISLVIDGFNILMQVMDAQREPWEIMQETIETQKSKWDELVESQRLVAEGDLAQIGHTQSLWTELQSLVDANGNVDEANRERAKFITDELNKVMPDAIQWNEDETLSINGTADAIDRMIEKKKAQIILEAKEPEYKEAILQARQLEQEQIEMSDEMYTKSMDILQLYIDKEDALNKGEWRTAECLQSSIDIKEAELERMREGYESNEETLSNYYTNIGEYEDLAAAIHSDNYEKIDEVNQSLGASFKTATNATEEELKKQLEDAKTHSNNMQRRYKEGAQGITEEMVRQAINLETRAQTEFNKVGSGSVNGVVAGINNNSSSLTAAWNRTFDNWFTGAKNKAGIKSPSKLFAKEIGAPLVEGIEMGFVKAAPDAFRKMVDAVDHETAGLTSSIMASANYRATPKWASLSGESGDMIPASGKIKTVLNIDGREFAVATANYMSEELAWRNL